MTLIDHTAIAFVAPVLRHRVRHRRTFVAAGIYNIGWGLFSMAWPQWFFASSVIICLTNDLIWWLPFAAYLRDAWPLSPFATWVRSGPAR